MRWLHLTDLHWGSSNEQQQVAAHALLSAIASSSSEKFDAVFITGDIAYSGKRTEYLSFLNDFLEPLRKLPIVGDAPIVAVPGNHDVDCSIGAPITWDQIGTKRQAQFFNFDETGVSIRSGRLRNFEAYMQFASENGILTPDFATKPADWLALPTLPHIELIALNTCYFSDYETKDKHQTPAPVHPLLYLLHKRHSQASQVIVLGHYPITWFQQRTQKHFTTKLVENRAIYLHGHEHEIETRFELSGLISLGFGASYVSPMTSASTPYYRNSFAICFLDDYLHIAPYAFDCENGRWAPESYLPPSFTIKSDILANGFKLPIARTPASESMKIESQRTYAAVKQNLIMGDPIWLAEDEGKAWSAVLRKLNVFHGIENIAPLPQDDRGRRFRQFIISDKSGKYYVRCVHAVGDILSKKFVEETNTAIDTQSMDAAVIITMGSVSEDARTLADQLERNRKPIQILDGKAVNQHLSTGLLRQAIESLAARHDEPISIHPLYYDDDIHLLLMDQLGTNWFAVAKLDGKIESSASEIVYKLRESQTYVKSLTYREHSGAPSTENNKPARTVPWQFDEVAYKRRCKDIHDDVQYPGLAAIGIQMPNKSLKQLYVPTGANAIASDVEKESMSLALADAVSALDLPFDQSMQLYQSLAGQYSLPTTAENSAATDLYERYGNILVEGDPGSGKSLFVRNAILNYCESSRDSLTWYSQHIPVFLPLAEIASLKRRCESLLEACADYARTTRLEIHSIDLDRLASQGRVAFFFDGLDEVSTIEERSVLVREISELIVKFGPLGNRFVLTSRPAALQTVDVPSELARLSLMGLTDAEMRLLAERILATSILSDGTRDLTDAQKQVVDRLVEDCKEVPGIRRLGRNPLLLTLLVLIYANSGPMVAKRHIIYSQAIRTLVSVRTRQIEREVLSEADLRRELGIIAFAIYDGNIQEIPTREEVILLLTGDDASAFFQSSDHSTINHFIETIANSTGLVRFHERSDNRLDDVLTFMHHSFLEYYAAVKLVDQNLLALLPAIAEENRWREIIILAAGIYSDRSEVTSVLRGLKDLSSSVDRVSGRTLNLALECASEADVPPKAAQTLLGDWILQHMLTGAVKASRDAREQLAKPLRSLIDNTHSLALARAISAGMTHNDANIAAGAIEIASFLDRAVEGFHNISEAFNNAFQRDDATIRASLIRAAGRSSVFRNNQSLQLFSRAILRGTSEERNAVYQALEANIHLSAKLTKELRFAVFQGGTHSYHAARVTLRAKAYRDPQSGVDIELLDRALYILIAVRRVKQAGKLAIVLDHDELEYWLHSSELDERIRALRLIGLSEQNFVRAYDLLLGIIKSEEPPELIAEAMSSVSMNSSIAALLKLDDIATIIKHAGSRFGNVRREAIILLGKVPPLESVVSQLLFTAMNAEKGGNFREYEECVASIGLHAEFDSRSSDYIIKNLIEELRKSERGWGEARTNKIVKLASALEHPYFDVSPALTALIAHIIWSHSTPENARNALSALLGQVAEPSDTNSCLIEELVSRRLKTHLELTCRSVLRFLRRCRGRVDYVRAVYPTLERIQGMLLSQWESEIKAQSLVSRESSLNLLRNCILEIDRLLRSYKGLGIVS